VPLPLELTGATQAGIISGIEMAVTGIPDQIK
jgi:hypothetical protein